MTRTGWLTVTALAGLLGTAVALDPPARGKGQPAPPSAEKPDAEKPAEIGWEVRTSDGKVHKVTPLDEAVTLETKFGTVKVPMKEVKRLEFGYRLSADDRKKVADAIADVVGGTGRTREEGKNTLLDFGLGAYPAVARAAKTAAKEAAPHLTQVKDKLAQRLGEEDDPPRDEDVILTADGSRLCGTLTPESVRVKLGGEEKALRWKDARVVAFGPIEVEEKVEVVVLGANGVHGLMQTHFEKVVGVEVVGVGQGSVWGSNPYTTDSTLGAAAVHAGVLKVGEKGIVKLKAKADAGGYTGTTQNGVTTGNWGPYQGCFEIVGKKKNRKD